MKPSIYLLFEKKIYYLMAFVGVFALTACGSYQNTGYARDGIYGSNNRDYRAEKPERTPQKSERRDGYYQNYFGEQHDKIVQAQDYLNEDDVFTDVDAYTSTPQQEEEREIYNVENQTYHGNQPSWGSNPTSVSVNIYNTGGYYNNPYLYGDFYGWGSPYYGYGGYPYYANNWYIGFRPYGGYYRPWGYGGYYGYYGNYYNPYYYGYNYYRNPYRNVVYHNGNRNYRTGQNYRSDSEKYGRSSSDYRRRRRVNNPNKVNARSSKSYRRSSAESQAARRRSSNNNSSNRNSYYNNSTRRSSSNNTRTYQPSTTQRSSTNSVRRSTPTRSSGSYGRSSSGRSSSGGGTRSSGRRR